MEPIHKFNNGRGAMICIKCRTIISTGPATKELYCEKCKPKQETTLEEAANNYANQKGNIPTTELEDAIFKQGFLDGAKWQQEQIGKSEFLQKLRATLSDAEARRLIFETFKNK